LNAETNILNHVLKTKDIIPCFNADVEKSFILYRDEWGFIKDYYTKHREVPPASVMEEKFKGFEFYDTEASIFFYIEELHRYKAKKGLSEIIMEAASGIKSETPFTMINRMQQELAKLGRDTKSTRDLDLIANSQERIDSLKERIDLRASGKSIIGIPSGVEKLDQAFGGWQRGDFIVVAGWTGSLKSWLALYFAQNAWLEGYRVLYFSLEMSGLQLGYRFDTLLSGREGEDYTNSSLTHATEDLIFDKYKTWLGEVTRDKHPFIVVTNEDLDEVTQNTVLAKIEHWKPDLVVLDYHGLFDEASGIQGEVEKTKQLSKAFKRIAIKTGVPIIDISGITQDKKDLGEKVPELGDLAWSKQLAYDSDLTLCLCKHDNGDGTVSVEVMSRKQRRGRDVHFRLNWDVDRGIVREMKRPTIFKQKDDDNEVPQLQS
jgi:replicative DNA helicase